MPSYDASRETMWRRSPIVFSLLDNPDTRGEYPHGHTVAQFLDEGTLSDYELIRAESWVIDEGWSPPHSPALPFDAIDIPNGVFTVENFVSGAREQFQIYTVQSGQWARRRVIKHKEDGAWKAHGFVNADNSWTMWSRFQSRQQEPCIVLNPALLYGLVTVSQEAGAVFSDSWHDFEYMGERHRLNVDEITCRQCNSEAECEDAQLCDEHRAYDATTRRTNRGTPTTYTRTRRLAMCEITHDEVR